MTVPSEFEGLPRLEGARERHVEGVAAAARKLYPADVDLCWAAALHDIGYVTEVADTGMHAIDGARWLRSRGFPDVVVSLVAWHTGARFEAEERGLVAELEEFAEPSQEKLDALNLCDLITSPAGEETSVEARIAEILQRYSPDHPVHRAVTRSRGALIESCRRALDRLDLPEGRCLPVL